MSRVTSVYFGIIHKIKKKMSNEKNDHLEPSPLIPIIMIEVDDSNWSAQKEVNR